MSTLEKSIILHPDRRVLWPWWLVGLLISLIAFTAFFVFFVFWVFVFIPVYGMIYLLWHLKRKKISYTITDHYIRVEDGNESVTLPLAELERVEIQRVWIPFSYGVGHLDLVWRQKSYRLEAIHNAQALQEMIQKASSFLKQQTRLHKTTLDPTSLPKPGTLEPLNDLVGLWQQGLLSDEAFEQEKKRLM